MSRPGWLIQQTCGLEAGRNISVFIDGITFAVVKFPGRKYRSGQSTNYGSVTYYLTDKRNTGFADAFTKGMELQSGGRVNKETVKRWKELVAEKDCEFPAIPVTSDVTS